MPLIAILAVAALLVLGYSLAFAAAVSSIDDINNPPETIPDIVRRQQARASERRRDEWLRTCFCRDARRTDWVDEFYANFGGES